MTPEEMLAEYLRVCGVREGVELAQAEDMLRVILTTTELRGRRIGIEECSATLKRIAGEG